MVGQVGYGNGLEAWRLLLERYESTTAGRLHHMLQKIMRPKQFPTDAVGFELALTEWEFQVQR